MSSSRESVEEFIRASFRSVWSLELLCLLRKHERPMSHDEMVDGLRASDFVIAKGLDNLATVGLVARGPEGSALYCPSSEEADRLAADTEALYASSPNAVRRIIAMATAPGITAFADAFRLRKDKE